jgi:hypothetical protein
VQNRCNIWCKIPVSTFVLHRPGDARHVTWLPGATYRPRARCRACVLMSVRSARFAMSGKPDCGFLRLGCPAVARVCSILRAELEPHPLHPRSAHPWCRHRSLIGITQPGQHLVGENLAPPFKRAARGPYSNHITVVAAPSAACSCACALRRAISSNTQPCRGVRRDPPRAHRERP